MSLPPGQLTESCWLDFAADDACVFSRRALSFFDYRSNNERRFSMSYVIAVTVVVVGWLVYELVAYFR